jgi:hypothetical protein
MAGRPAGAAAAARARKRKASKEPPRAATSQPAAVALHPIGVASCVGGVCLKIRYIHNYRTSTSKVSKSDQENHILRILRIEKFCT